jgi:hypothetical protein
MVKNGSKPFYAGLVSSRDLNPQQAAIFISPSLLPYFNQCLEMGMNGTFRSKPSHQHGIKQVIVITIFIFGRVSFSFMHDSIRVFYRNLFLFSGFIVGFCSCHSFVKWEKENSLQIDFVTS